MMAKDMIMAGHERSPGEIAAAARRKRLWTTIGILFAVGFFVGLAAALVEIDPSPIWLSGTFPAWFGVTAAIVTGTALLWGSVAFYRRIDELERMDNLYAGAVGTNVTLIAYFIWFPLWKGGLVAEPGHEILMAILFGSTAIAYLWRKFR